MNVLLVYAIILQTLVILGAVVIRYMHAEIKVARKLYSYADKDRDYWYKSYMEMLKVFTHHRDSRKPTLLQ